MSVSVDEITIAPELFQDKMTIIFGASQSGKSVVVVDILHSLRSWADQIVVISPTNAQNHTYTDIVPGPLIWAKLTSEFLNDFWERQEMMQATYSRANNLDILRGMFLRCAPSDKKAIDAHLAREKEAAIYTARRDGKLTQIKEIETHNRAFLLPFYKDTIIRNKSRLGALTDAEDFAVRYIDFNPRIVLVFDDCTADIKNMRKHKVIQELFYQGRHSAVTTIIAAHTEKALDPELRKNAFTVMWTEPASAVSYCAKEFKDDRDMSSAMRAAIHATFVPDRKYQKLALIRTERRFVRFTATFRLDQGFRFGSSVLWDFMEKITRGDHEVSDTNKFMSDFIGR